MAIWEMTSWCKGRLTEADVDHLAGCHSICTNQCPPPPSPQRNSVIKNLAPVQLFGRWWCWLWPPCRIGQATIFSSRGFFSFFFFYSSPNLSSCRLDVYHTSTHGVALVRIYDAGLKCAARGSLKIQDAKSRQKIAIWAPSYNFFGLPVYLHN